MMLEVWDRAGKKILDVKETEPRQFSPTRRVPAGARPASGSGSWAKTGCSCSRRTS